LPADCVGALPVERGAVQGALRLTPRADAGGGQPAVDFGEQFFHLFFLG
jgi:hypothetical protein